MASNNTPSAPPDQVRAGHQTTSTRAGANATSAVTQRSVQAAMSINNLLNPLPSTNDSAISRTTTGTTPNTTTAASRTNFTVPAVHDPYSTVASAPSIAPSAFPTVPMSGRTANVSRRTLQNTESQLSQNGLHGMPRSSQPPIFPSDDEEHFAAGSKRKRTRHHDEVAENMEAVNGRERGPSKKRTKTSLRGHGSGSAPEEDEPGIEERFSTTQNAYYGWAGESHKTKPVLGEQQVPEQRPKRQATQTGKREEEVGSRRLPSTTPNTGRRPGTPSAVDIGSTNINQQTDELTGSLSDTTLNITTPSTAPPNPASIFQSGESELDFPTLANLWRNNDRTNEDALELVRTDLSSSPQAVEEEDRQFEAYVGEMYEETDAESWLDSV